MDKPFPYFCFPPNFFTWLVLGAQEQTFGAKFLHEWFVGIRVEDDAWPLSGINVSGDHTN